MKRKIIRFAKWFFGINLILINLMAAFHAHKFAQIDAPQASRSKAPKQMDWVEKTHVLFFGVRNPKSENKRKPVFLPYTNVFVQSNGKKLSGWFLRKTHPKGTVLIFHGYLSCKSHFLNQAHQFYQLGYQVLLLDLEAHGDSEGSQTSFGYKESDNVKAAVEMVKKLDFHEGKIILFGSSLGAVAVMKALAEGTEADAAILESPFGSFRTTVQKRFENMGFPSFPATDLLIFHGSLQENIWFYAHEPMEYARKIKIPTLLLYGFKDSEVGKDEIETIYANLQGEKQWAVLKGEHSRLFTTDGKNWLKAVKHFLEN